MRIVNAVVLNASRVRLIAAIATVVNRNNWQAIVYSEFAMTVDCRCAYSG